MLTVKPMYEPSSSMMAMSPALVRIAAAESAAMVMNVYWRRRLGIDHDRRFCQSGD